MNVHNKPLTVHPAAEAYRLMTEDELAALAADIAENGQHDPIMLGRARGSDEYQIIDGRNRVKACEIAGVQPKLETRDFLDDEAIRAFVKSRSERRDITKGQRAMGHAWNYPEPEKGGRGKKSVNSKETLGFSIMRLSQAREVLAYSRELAVKVRDGVETLDEALAKVKAERKQHDSAEAMLARLRAEAPDLADLVAEERLTLKDAIAALDQRISEAQRTQQTATGVLYSVFNTLFPRGAAPPDWAARMMADVRTEFWSGSDPLTPENLQACADTLRAMAEIWRQRP